MRKKKIFFAVGLILLFSFFSLLAAQWDGFSVSFATKPPTEKVPSPLLKWPEKGSEYAILVDKSLQKVFVYHRDNPYQPHRTYTCSTGENQGPKVREKDRKTPEGVYFFVRAIDKKELLPIYGSRAYALDYPNVIDRKEGKNGHGIWFHGLNKPLKPRDTNGCVALVNPDIDDLANFIRIDDTPVIVSERIEMVAPSEMEKDREEVIRIIETWQTSWERKDVDKYMSLYSPDFTSSGKNWQQWKEHKARLAKQYNKIKVDVQNLRILQNDGLVLASFLQKYSNEYFNSAGRKTLYLKHASRWRIVGEHFEGSELKPSIQKELPAPEEIKPVIAAKEPEVKAEEPKPVQGKKESALPVEETKPVLASEEPLAPVEKSKPGLLKKESRPAGELNKDIRRMLDSWKKAWEQKDVASYMSFYDSGFQSRGMDFKAWKKHRKKLNQKYRSITIDISELKIERTSAVIASVSFTQKYEADDYEDEGLKSLLLVKRGKDWKIKEEEWKPLDQESRP
ncbi:MAG: L,D-transpeptidase family protein [Deltaproteobacteria bacterium]|jgi:murein L,D-transpeptidase YafK|nr:L,D-transpeptidase family protein [Deltaproteobacteria bacterium]NTV55928.1 L,D-transpeptidase family protein [Deltaproteobacteria bacterium]